MRKYPGHITAVAVGYLIGYALALVPPPFPIGGTPPDHVTAVFFSVFALAVVSDLKHGGNDD